MLYEKSVMYKEEISMATIKMKLQGHEKFALREGWINKALRILPDLSLIHISEPTRP